MAAKITVNLYLPSMRPVKEKLPLSLMVSCWLLALVAMTALGTYQQGQFDQIARQQKEVALKLTASKNQLAKLEARHADFKPSPQLMTKLERLSQELNGKRFLSQHLKGRAVPKEQKYSEVMLDLARLHSDQLWMTQIRFEEDEVSIQGFALDALAVPQWLSRLQQSAFFSGKSFALMNLDNQTQVDGLIQFEINTLPVSSLTDEQKLAAIKALSQKAGAQDD